MSCTIEKYASISVILIIDIHSAFVIVVRLLLLFFLFLARCLCPLSTATVTGGRCRGVWLFIWLGLLLCFLVHLGWLIFFVIIFIVVIHVLLTLFNTLAHPATVLLIILAIHYGCCVIGWRIYVGVGQQRLDRRQDAGNVVDGWPGVLEDVQAYRAVCVNVRVEHFGEELDFGRFVGVLLGKFNG